VQVSFFDIITVIGTPGDILEGAGMFSTDDQLAFAS
jgi:hypothetical protein